MALLQSFSQKVAWKLPQVDGGFFLFVCVFDLLSDLFFYISPLAFFIVFDGGVVPQNSAFQLRNHELFYPSTEILHQNMSG